jgi:hypothetical protein
MEARDILDHDYAELTWFKTHGTLTTSQAHRLLDVKYQLAVYYGVIHA